ncbi:phage regulatory protein/antirepressor Ant [Lysinibacillus sp. FSL K6-0102]|uniref:phage regulatory protein/antirepressor Ant n=1 Tax=Lysinibacillus sp. FSL K6-0102 TaxID=2975290 RepID=UPI0030FA2BE6
MVKELKVMNHEGKLVTDSRDVADMVEKEHKHLMRDIRGYIEILGKSNFGLSDFFIESTYKSSQNKDLPCYLLTKKGCDMVANKLTGEKGVLFTAAYVTKFEEMANAIKSKSPALPMTYKEALQALLIEVEKNESLQIENSTFKQQIGEMKPKVSYYDIVLKSPSALSVTEISKDYGMSANKFNRLLHDLGIQYKQGKVWFLYSKYHDKGYTKTETFTYDIDKTRVSTKWTQKGRLFLYDILKQNNVLPMIEQDFQYIA